MYGCIFGVALQTVNGARRRRNGENVTIKGPSLDNDRVLVSPHTGIQEYATFFNYNVGNE